MLNNRVLPWCGHMAFESIGYRERAATGTVRPTFRSPVCLAGLLIMAVGCAGSGSILSDLRTMDAGADLVNSIPDGVIIEDSLCYRNPPGAYVNDMGIAAEPGAMTASPYGLCGAGLPCYAYRPGEGGAMLSVDGCRWQDDTARVFCCPEALCIRVEGKDNKCPVKTPHAWNCVADAVKPKPA